jgi:hypothetical protein
MTKQAEHKEVPVEEQEATAQVFYFDDFVVGEDDPGVEVPVEIRGQVIPIRFHRGLTIEDREAAKNAGITRRVRPEGTIELLSIREDIIQLENVTRAIKSWPFTDREGKPIPVTKQNVKALGAEALDALFFAYQKVSTGRAQALVPFVMPSDAA